MEGLLNWLRGYFDMIPLSYYSENTDTTDPDIVGLRNEIIRIRSQLKPVPVVDKMIRPPTRHPVLLQILTKDYILRDAHSNSTP